VALGLQQLIAYFAPTQTHANERWTLPKLHLQKLRLKVSGESDRTGQGPYDVVLSALLDVVREDDLTATKATTLQAAWRRRNVQGKFQTAVQEMMEINGLIEDIERREEELKVKQDASAAQIERAMQQDMMDEPPPKMPSEKDMKNPAKMQEYMLQMGEYSARQQLKLQTMNPDVAANQELTAEAHKLAEEKRKLQNLSDKLQFSVSTSKMSTLTPEEARKVMQIQEQLGVTTPRGTISNPDVRVVTLMKASQSTRLGIIFHQSTPEALVTDADKTPRGNAGDNHIVIPIIKVLDKSGIAGQPDPKLGRPLLSEGDQVLSVNGQAALSNIQAVQMLREAVGEVKLAVTSTKISVQTPRANGAPAPNYSSGLRPINVQ